MAISNLAESIQCLNVGPKYYFLPNTNIGSTTGSIMGIIRPFYGKPEAEAHIYWEWRSANFGHV